MTSETKRASEEAAYQLGWMAYENGERSDDADMDEDFVQLCCDDYGHIQTMKIAYGCGFRDALRAAREG